MRNKLHGYRHISMHISSLVGVTRLLRPDNLRTGVSKADRYEPEINPVYRDMGRVLWHIRISGKGC